MMKQIKNMNVHYPHRFRSHFRILSLILLLAVISGCGFQLRGEIVLPPLYERVHVVTKGQSDVGEALTKALKNVGSKIVPTPAAATSVVTVLSSGTQRRAINVAGNTIREYELQLNISFVVQDHKGVQLSDQQTVSVVRNFQNDPNNVLGKDNEEKVIRKEMMSPAIIQVLRRMKAIAK
jgi:LPS-assembly lipoprotein